MGRELDAHAAARIVRRLAAVAAVFCAATVTTCALSEPDGTRPGKSMATAVEEYGFAPGYVGSDACAECHRAEYRAWKETLHSKMEQPATPDRVIGEFTPEGSVVSAEAPGKRIVMIRDGDRFLIEAPDGKGRPRRYPIDRTVGNRFKQRYLTKLPDGSWHALPVQWFEKDRKFVEWHGLASGEPGSGHFWMDEAWQWQLRCAGCHTTGLDLGYDPETKTYETRWRELAIGCEACHGPGAEHVRAGGGTGNVLCPSRMTQEQQLETCGKCHSRGTAGPEEGAPSGLPGRLAYPLNMLPGSDLDAHYRQVTPEANAKDFHPDGSSRNHHQQLTDYRKSPMLHEGGGAAPVCTTCHDPHRANAMRKPVETNAVCTQCHDEFIRPTDLAAHTGHGSDPKANEGARCTSCHMPRIVAHAGSRTISSHTFWWPNPAVARQTSSPDACLLCHTDRDRSWSEREATRIWPDLSDPR